MFDTEGWVIRVLGLAGAVGGLLWTIVMVAAGVTFLGIDLGLLGVRNLIAIGALFRVVGLAVPLMLGGVIGLHLFAREVYGDLGRVGTFLVAIGFVLLLPGSLVPSGSLPGLSRFIPFVFFAGLIAIAIGSAVVGYAAVRSQRLPSVLAIFHGVAMPGGGLLGAVLAVAGAGNIAFVLGFSVPYGLSWIAVGAFLATR